MFAHVIVAFTGPQDVQWTEVAEPAAGDGVVIDVAAAGVSFADLLQTKGGYQMKVPVPYTPGMGLREWSGRPRLALASPQASGLRYCCPTAAGRRSSAPRRSGCCRCRRT